jgi:hypothetical protein
MYIQEILLNLISYKVLVLVQMLFAKFGLLEEKLQEMLTHVNYQEVKLRYLGAKTLQVLILLLLFLMLVLGLLKQKNQHVK